MWRQRSVGRRMRECAWGCVVDAIRMIGTCFRGAHVLSRRQPFGLCTSGSSPTEQESSRRQRCDGRTVRIRHHRSSAINNTQLDDAFLDSLYLLLLITPMSCHSCTRTGTTIAAAAVAVEMGGKTERKTLCMHFSVGVSRRKRFSQSVFLIVSVQL